MINSKLAPFATKTIVEYLGSEEEELLSAVTSHLRAHKDAAALVDELEPVRTISASSPFSITDGELRTGPRRGGDRVRREGVEDPRLRA